MTSLQVERLTREKNSLEYQIREAPPPSAANVEGVGSVEVEAAQVELASMKQRLVTSESNQQRLEIENQACQQEIQKLQQQLQMANDVAGNAKQLQVDNKKLVAKCDILKEEIAELRQKR